MQETQHAQRTMFTTARGRPEKKRRYIAKCKTYRTQTIKYTKLEK